MSEQKLSTYFYFKREEARRKDNLDKAKPTATVRTIWCSVSRIHTSYSPACLTSPTQPLKAPVVCLLGSCQFCFLVPVVSGGYFWHWHLKICWDPPPELSSGTPALPHNAKFQLLSVTTPPNASKTNTTWVTLTLPSLAASMRYILVYKFMKVKKKIHEGAALIPYKTSIVFKPYLS